MSKMPDSVTLNNEGLAFIRMLGELFPNLESPLRFLEDEDREPDNPEATFEHFEESNFWDDTANGTAETLIERLTPVSECQARILLVERNSDERKSRSFYFAENNVVEYQRDKEEHHFGPVRSEAALCAEIAQRFKTRDQCEFSKITLSAGDYLVFAVFARDLRASENVPENDEDSPMTVDEVLAFFDEPETKVVRMPDDDSWTTSVAHLAEQNILLPGREGYRIHPALCELAKQIVADNQYTIARFDYLDEQWLTREINLYPTEQSVYRFGTEPDGSVLLQELTTGSLADTLSGTICTLPNILNPEIQTSLRAGTT